MSLHEEVTSILLTIERANAINCTGLGEVGCAGRQGWHSWTEHRNHVAADQFDALAEAGLLAAEVSA